MGTLVRMAFQNCAKPWMAELKRHRDVPKERVLESHPHKQPCSTVNCARNPGDNKARHISRTARNIGPV